MFMADFLVDVLFHLPAAGLAWVLRRTTRLSPHSAEQVAEIMIVGIVAAVCVMAWLMYLG